MTKVYQRVCRRCNTIYHSYIKKSRFCPSCYKGSQFKKVFGELNQEAIDYDKK